MAKITARPGDTWDAIAARELGNATLGGEIAGANGYGAHQAVPDSAELEIPYRAGEPPTKETRRAQLQAELKALEIDEGDAPPAPAREPAAPPPAETVEEKRERLRTELNATYES